MTEEQQIPREVAEIVERSMRHFNHAMRHQNAVVTRNSRRTNQIVRFGIFVLIILISILFSLIYILAVDLNNITHRLDDIAAYMENVNNNFSIVAKDMREIKQATNELSKNIGFIEVMNSSISQVSINVLSMSGDMQSIGQSMNSVNQNLEHISADMESVSLQLDGINHQFTSVGYNVNKMARPMKFFPFGD